MLQRLHIRNYAIIDDLAVHFSEGLNIITGETGAGKSILMGALNLILGQRADSAVLQDASKKCVVEGHFKVKETAALQTFFAAYDLDADLDILVRREIAANGKSRSFINDTPVNLSQVKELGLLLVDLHQQFDTLDIHSASFQRDVLDALADNATLLARLREQYHDYSKVYTQLQQLQTQQQAADKELDYHRFLFEELDTLALKERELEDLDAELKLLSNAGSVRSELDGIAFLLKEGEQPVVQQLKTAVHRLRPLENLHPSIKDILQRLQSTVIELDDIAGEVETVSHSVQSDEQRMVEISDRLSAGYKLLKKHGVQETAQLLQILESLKGKLEVVENLAEKIAKLNQEKDWLLKSSLQLAGEISAKRHSKVKQLETNVNKLLIQVGMPNARLKVAMETGNLSAFGTDDVSFLFDANKSNRFEPVGKVASGGELSRLMLSIKSLVAKKLALPTLIFDEIDTGISGEAARQVGIIMKELAEGHQLIAITHQAQIAAKAAAHYFVYKEISGDKIVTNIRLLGNDERITAIAKMLSGEKPTAAALANARELVGN